MTKNQKALSLTYGDDFIYEQEKTSQPLVTVNWSAFGDVFSLLEGIIWSDFLEVLMGFAVIFVMIVLANMFS